MGDSRKRHALTEGMLGKIYRWFIHPTTKFKPEEMTLSDFHAKIFFDVENVTIDRFVVKKGFKMPGLLYAAGAVKVQGIGFRDIKKNTKGYVRRDVRQPFYDVQVFVARHGDQTFSLTESEWNTIAANLRVITNESK